MPIDPIARAKSKLVISRIERDCYTLLRQLEQPERRGRPAARRQLAQRLAAGAEVFDTGMPFFLSDAMTMMDCVLAPVLWRLDHYGIELPPEAASVSAYARRLFAREPFAASLTRIEQGMQRGS
jgi:RNA polymerase-associated protein